MSGTMVAREVQLTTRVTYTHTHTHTHTAPDLQSESKREGPEIPKPTTSGASISASDSHPYSISGLYRSLPLIFNLDSQ